MVPDGLGHYKCMTDLHQKQFFLWLSTPVWTTLMSINTHITTKCLLRVQAVLSWLVYLPSLRSCVKIQLMRALILRASSASSARLHGSSSKHCVHIHPAPHRLPKHKLSKQLENPICLLDLIFEAVCLPWNSQTAWLRLCVVWTVWSHADTGCYANICVVPKQSAWTVILYVCSVY